MTECIAALKQTHSFPPLRQRVRVENPKRNLRWDASEHQMGKLTSEGDEGGETGVGAFGSDQDSSRSHRRNRLQKTSSFSFRENSRPVCSKQYVASAPDFVFFSFLLCFALPPSPSCVALHSLALLCVALHCSTLQRFHLPLFLSFADSPREPAPPPLSLLTHNQVPKHRQAEAKEKMEGA